MYQETCKDMDDDFESFIPLALYPIGTSIMLFFSSKLILLYEPNREILIHVNSKRKLLPDIAC